MIFAIALLAQPGVFFRFGLPIPVSVPVFYGPAYYSGGYYYGPYSYALYPRPAIDIGLTATGATIEKVPSGSQSVLSIFPSKMKL
jgi:hypothetical protein